MPATADGESALATSIRKEWMRQVSVVRKQEFAYLRGVLKRDAGDGAEPTLAGVPVRPPTAGKVRGDTLKKIDEIEAQLDNLWHATRSKLRESGFSLGSALSGTTLAQVSALRTAPLLPAATDTLQQASQFMRHTEMPSSVLLMPMVEAATTILSTDDAPQIQNVAPAPQASEPAASELALDTAATLFADADYRGAERALLRTVAGKRDVDVQCLLGLLEIYRATGDQVQFDALVLDYFHCWGGRTPQWHSGPVARPGAGKASYDVPADDTRFGTADLEAAQVWRCPALLNLAAARKLRAHWLANNPCGIDWTALSSIDAAASAELVACFTQAQSAPSQLVFVNMHKLLGVLEQATPQGQAHVARSLWELRFCLLSLMQMRTAFDTAVTDFCLTYIEPAPQWKVSQINFIGDALDAAPAPFDGSKARSWRLQGHVLGETGLGLPEIPALSKPQRIAISCAALVRMDAGAIAQLREWLHLAKAKMAEVHLQEVGVLVGTAWSAAGIGTLAQVHLRDFS